MLPWCHPASSAGGGPLCGAGQAAPGPVTAAFRHSLAGRGPDRCAAPGSIRLRASAGLSPCPGSLWPRLERTLPVRCLVQSSVRSGRRAVNTEAGEGRGLRRGWSGPPRKRTEGVRAGVPQPTRTSNGIGAERRRARCGGRLAHWAWRGLERRLIDTMGEGLL